MKKEIKGKMVFDSIDGAKARFNLEDADGLIVKRVSVERDLLPPEFEQPRFSVKGAYSFAFEVKDTQAKKKAPKRAPKKKK